MARQLVPVTVLLSTLLLVYGGLAEALLHPNWQEDESRRIIATALQSSPSYLLTQSPAGKSNY